MTECYDRYENLTRVRRRWRYVDLYIEHGFIEYLIQASCGIAFFFVSVPFIVVRLIRMNNE